MVGAKALFGGDHFFVETMSASALAAAALLVGHALGKHDGREEAEMQTEAEQRQSRWIKG